MVESKDKKYETGTAYKIILGVLASFVVALFPYFFLISKNYILLGHDDFWVALGIVSAHWVVVFLLNLTFLRSVNKASLATTVAVIPLSVFQLGLNIIKRFIPAFYFWHGVILFVMVYGVLLFLIRNELKSTIVTKLNTIIGLVFFVLVLANVIPTLINQIREHGLSEKKTTVLSTDRLETLESKHEVLPNIYLFLFDEYSGPEALERYTGYDNRRFYDDLSKLGFNISPNSTNYTISTSVEIPNLLNLSILTLEVSEKVKDESMQNPVLFSTLRAIGYDFNLINDQAFIATPLEYFKYHFTPQGILQRDENLVTLLIDMSVYYPLRRESSLGRIVEVREMFDYAAESSLLQEENLFTFGYFMFPHLQWVVDENGYETPANDRHDWSKSDVYLGQLKYANKLILEMVEKILSNDPNSCIILMSDHAYRQPYHLQKYYNVTYDDPVAESYYQRNILNAVYLAGQTLDINGLSGINTLRLVLDELFSLDLGAIDTP